MSSFNFPEQQIVSLRDKIISLGDLIVRQANKRDAQPCNCLPNVNELSKKQNEKKQKKTMGIVYTKNTHSLRGVT